MIELMSAYWSEFLTVALLHALAVISPGPDFAVVVKQSVSHGKQVGRNTALGVGAAILIHVGYSLLGIGILIRSSETLFSLMKYAAAFYLIFLGINGIRSKANKKDTIEKMVKEKVAIENSKFWPSFRTGFLTNGLNPKATLFFLSLFTVAINPNTPVMIQVGYGFYMALMTAIWFIFVATIFGHNKVRRRFESMGHWFDRVMGLALIGLGLKIAMASFAFKT